MKNVMLLLSLLFISLFVSNAMNAALFSDMDGVEECVEASGFEACVDNTKGYIIPASDATSESDKAFADAQSLAGQLRVVQRPLFHSAHSHQSAAKQFDILSHGARCVSCHSLRHLLPRFGSLQ